MVEVAAVRTSRVVVRETLLRLAAVLGLAIFALTLTHFLSRHPPSLLIILGFAVVLLGSLALAIFAYDAAVAVGVLLLAAVRFQPAPTDIVFGVLMVVAYATGRFSLRRLTAGPLLLAGTFLAFNLVSMLAVVDALRAVQFLGITIYVLIFALWLASSVTDSSIARRITKWYVIGAIVSALLSTLALLVPFPGHDLFTRIGRGEGLFKDPNVFGPFLVPAALIMLEEILTPRLLSWRRSTKVLSFLILALGVLFSYSRAAWLNLVVGLLVMVVVFSFRRGAGRSAARAVALVLVACVALGAVVSFTGSLSFLKERARVQTYDSGRFAGQDESLKWAVRYPVGIGPGQFETRAHIAAHSLYARALAEEGIPGLIALLALMLGTLGWAGHNAILGRDTYGVGSAALLGAWCGVLANSFFVDTLHWRHLWLLAALIWAGSARPGFRSRAPS
jgi:O-Antigen ligase